MRLADLGLPKNFLERLGVQELNPPQRLAVEAGLLDGQNLVVAAPTASGKTLIAELAMLRAFAGGGKAVYLSPLKALASEKYFEFKKKYSELGLRIALSIGDYDTAEDWLGRYDVIITTNEKMDSLIRHQASWLKLVTLIVADEIHLMNDPGRGPTLEVVLTRLRGMTSAQMLALSATISNADQIAQWLGAKLVRSDWRPIPLYRGVVYPNGLDGDEKKFAIEFDKTNSCAKNVKQRRYDIGGDDTEPAVIEDTVQRGKQLLVFLATRRYSEASAEKACKVVSRFLDKDERQALASLAREIESALPHPTKQCLRLARCVRHGAAFHHAGLVAKQRAVIEKGFRSGTIKVLTATPTLAFGVNLPAWRVLIRDAKRYGVYGMEYIPTLEVQQMCGRAGRPAYDTEGEAVLLGRSDSEAEELAERYIRGEPEPIESKLAAEPALRMHTLALVAAEAVRSRDELLGFFRRTFFGFQSEDFGFVEKKIDKILRDLEKWGFLESAEEESTLKSTFGDFKPAWAFAAGDIILRATHLGRRVAELYIDPLSAWTLLQNMAAPGDMERLLSICECAEMQPLLRVKRAEWDEYAGAASGLAMDIPGVWDVDYEEFLARLKTAMLLHAWMDEVHEDAILSRFGMPPGELYAKKLAAEWMLYAAKELALVEGRKATANEWNRLMLRVQHGVRTELLELVQLRGIGRVRARLLWQNKIRSIADVKRVPEDALAKIVGPKVAKGIKEDVTNK
ncbi:MAG: DEAD/DEAH box helicase [Candidatus Aenigmatarchaeota archaeon]